MDRGPGVRFKGGAHGAMGVMESRSGRARRDAKRLGDLGGLEPEVVMEHEDRPLFGRQPSEPTFEQVPVGHAQEVIVCRRPVDRQDPKVRGPMSLADSLGDTDIDQETL